MGSSNFTILNSGYTQNIKDPILFNKLLSKSVYSQPTANDWLAVANNTFTKPLYIKPIMIMSEELFNKISDLISQYNINTDSYELYENALYTPFWAVEDRIKFQSIPTAAINTYFPDIDTTNFGENVYAAISDERTAMISNDFYSKIDWWYTNYTDNNVLPYVYLNMFRYKSIPLFSNENAIDNLNLIVEGEFYYNNDNGALCYNDEFSTPVVGENGTFYKDITIPEDPIYYLYDAEYNEFYQYTDYDPSDFIAYLKNVIKINNVLLNGFTIEGENNEPDTIVPGIKEYFGVISGREAIDLPSEEALANNEIKSGTTFEDKFNEIENKVEEAINSIDLSDYQQTYDANSSAWLPSYYASDIASGSLSYSSSYKNCPVTASTLSAAFGYNVSKYGYKSSDWDTNPTSGSSNPVTSNGIYNAINSAKKDIKKSIEPSINFYSYKEGFISLDFSNISKWESFVDGMTENYEYIYKNLDNEQNILYTRLYVDITNKLVYNEVFVKNVSDGNFFATVYNFGASSVRVNINITNSSINNNNITYSIVQSGGLLVAPNEPNSWRSTGSINSNDIILNNSWGATSEIPIYGIFNDGTTNLENVISASRKIAGIYPNASYKIRKDYDFASVISQYANFPTSGKYNFRVRSTTASYDLYNNENFISNINTSGIGVNTMQYISAVSKNRNSSTNAYPIYAVPYGKEIVNAFGFVAYTNSSDPLFYYFITFRNSIQQPIIYITPTEDVTLYSSSTYRFNISNGLNPSQSGVSSAPVSIQNGTYQKGKWYYYYNDMNPQKFAEIDIDQKEFIVIPSSSSWNSTTTRNWDYLVNYDVFKYTENNEQKEVDFTKIFSLLESADPIKNTVESNKNAIESLQGDLKDKVYDSTSEVVYLRSIISDLTQRIAALESGNINITATVTTSGYFDIKMPYFKNILKTDVTLTEHQTEGITDYYTVEFDITPLINLPALSNFEVYKPEIDFNDSTKLYFDETTFEISDSGVGSAREIKLIGKCSVAGYSALQNDSVIFDEVRIYMRAIDNTIEDQSNEGGE